MAPPVATIPLTGKEALVALINSANGTNFTVDDLSFSDLVSNDGPLNTSVLVTAVPSSGYSGSVRVNYGRLDPEAALPPRGYPFSTEVVYEGETHWRDMIPKINTAFNITLTDNDITDNAVITVPQPLPQEMSLRFMNHIDTAQPHAWYGYLTMTFVDPVGGTYPIMDWNVELGGPFRDYSQDFLAFNKDLSNPDGRTDGWFARLTEAPLPAFADQSPIIAWRAYDFETGPADAEYNPENDSYMYHFGGADPLYSISSAMDIIVGMGSLGYDDALEHPNDDFMRSAVLEVQFAVRDYDGIDHDFYTLTSVYNSGDGGFTMLEGPTGTFGPSNDVVVTTGLQYTAVHPDGGSYSYIGARIPLQDLYGLIRGTSLWDGGGTVTLVANFRLYNNDPITPIDYATVTGAVMMSESGSYTIGGAL